MLEQRLSRLPTRRQVLFLAILLLIVVVLVFLLFQQQVVRRLRVALDFTPVGQVSLQLPPGFVANSYAAGLHRPRFMAVGPDGTLFVAESQAGRVIALPDTDGNGVADKTIIVAEGLDTPTSLAFYNGMLYVGETSRVTRFAIGPNLRGTDRTVIVPDLPGGGNHPPNDDHTTRTVLIGPDQHLYVSIGSTCNICIEVDPRRASVLSYNLDGSNGRIYAHGLRNAVGIATNPWTQEIWATNNGRDWLGDDIPPETVYILKDGADYGWPHCHVGNIVDPDFPGSCNNVEEPIVEMVAHSAPLGLAFYNGTGFPAEYHSLYIAQHGSWNRTEPSGYRIVRVPLRDGHVVGAAEDFATGWMRSSGKALGRPAGIVMGKDGSLYVSDDLAGLIYRISWKGNS